MPAQLERVPDSLALKAKSEHNAVLPGVPSATETAVLSPHISPGVPSTAQLAQLHSCQRPASCWRGRCCSSAMGNSGAMGHTNLAHPKLSPPLPPALLLWAQSSHPAQQHDFRGHGCHRTSGLNPAFPRTRTRRMIGRLHSLGFPGEQCLGGLCCLQPHSVESISCTASKPRAL